MKLDDKYEYVKTPRGTVVHVVRRTTDPFDPALCRFEFGRHGFVGTKAKEPTCKLCKRAAIARGVLLPLLLVLLSACGRIGVGEDFRAHVDAFEDVLQARGVDATTKGIGVQFAAEGELPQGTSARCFYGLLFRSPHILVSRGSWEAFGDGYRRAIVFHELGHCALGRKHVGKDERSLMVESVFSVTGEYEAHRDEFEEELVKDAPRKETP